MPHQQTPPAAADVAADVAYEVGELHRAGHTRAQAVHTLHTMATESAATGDELFAHALRAAAGTLAAHPATSDHWSPAELNADTRPVVESGKGSTETPPARTPVPCEPTSQPQYPPGLDVSRYLRPPLPPTPRPHLDAVQHRTHTGDRVMPTNTATGKQAAAATAKTLLADRIALVETLGAALDTHRRAEESVTTARAAAANAAQQARDAYDAAKSGGWTAAELNEAGLRAPTASRPRKNNPTATTHDTTGTDDRSVADDDVAGAA